jgi:hypothetical protein
MPCSFLLIALSIMCCLLAARGEASEEGWSEIRSIIEAKFAEWKSEVDAKFSSIAVEFTSSNAEFAELKSEIYSKFACVDAEIDDLRQMIVKGFQDRYNFEREQISILSAVSSCRVHA